MDHYKHPLTGEQRAIMSKSVAKAVAQICDAWDDATNAAAARGYGGSSDQVVVSGGSESDPTAAQAMRTAVAAEWLHRASTTLALMLRFADAAYASRNGEIRNARWCGSFDPPRMRSTMVAAGKELVDLWPRRVQRVFDRIYTLADDALREWPSTPKVGQVVDGVTVGKRSSLATICTKCTEPIGGGAADPIRRINGSPYHGKSCYFSAWRALKKLPA